VFTKQPVAWDDGIVVVSGKPKVAENSETGLFFQLKDAVSSAEKPVIDKKSKPPV
jgi:hypothetical protein